MTSTRHVVRIAVVAILVATISVPGALLSAATGPSDAPGTRPTVVLVHGAFADASGWNDVIVRLQRRGYQAFAPANPLRGLPGDAAYLASILDTIDGPIILVGHSYGGMVMTNAAAGDPDVEALVYVAAFAPAEGDTVGGLATMFPGSLLTPDNLVIRPYPATEPAASGLDGYIRADVFREVFAGDLPRRTTDAMAATQRPAEVVTLQQPSGPPAWATIPSWFVVATDDHTIPAAAQRFMAQRAGAVETVEVRASHVVMMSKPAAVAAVIDAAAKHGD